MGVRGGARVWRQGRTTDLDPSWEVVRQIPTLPLLISDAGDSEGMGG